MVAHRLLQNSVRDKLSPINITLEYWLPRDSVVNDAADNEYDSRLTPILNHVVPSFLSKKVAFRKNCGSDGICVPDLELSAKLLVLLLLNLLDCLNVLFRFRNVNEYVVGSRKKLEMAVSVRNNKEDAYETKFHLRMPYDVNYVRVNKTATHVSSFSL